MVRRKPERFERGPELPGVPLHERGLEARVVLVNPTLAEQWLKQNVDNRKHRPSRWQTYGRDMAGGSWELTGEPIIFDSTNHLRNGQHRLMACIAAGAPFWTVVIWGVDPATFLAMDRGASRTIADVLDIDGEASATALAATAALVYRDERGLSLRATGSTVTSAEAVDIVARHPELRDSLHVRNGSRRVGLTPRLAIFAHYKLARIDKAEADYFFDVLYEGAGLASGDPILALRNQLTGDRTDVKHDLMKQYAWIVMAWNHWRAGKNIKLIRWSGPKLPKPE